MFLQCTYPLRIFFISFFSRHSVLLSASFFPISFCKVSFKGDNPIFFVSNFTTILSDFFLKFYSAYQILFIQYLEKSILSLNIYIEFCQVFWILHTPLYFKNLFRTGKYLIYNLCLKNILS